MTTPLPPGSSGWPLVGETGAFIRDPFGFVETQLQRWNTPIFRTHVFFRPTVVIAGPDAAALWLDTDKITRVGSTPPHMVTLFGGRNLSIMDGAAHRERKAQLMRAFDAQALSAYVPIVDRIVRQTLAQLAAHPGAPCLDTLRDAAVAAICECALGLPSGPEQAALTRDYALLLRGFLAVPVPLPGTTYMRARRALRRIHARLMEQIHLRAAAAEFDVAGEWAGIDALLAARMSPEVAAVELHHSVVAGTIVFGQLCGILLRLAKDPARGERLRTELAALDRGAAGDRTATRSLSALDPSTSGLPQLTAFVWEVRRLTPILPFSFGRARTAFEFGGYRVPKGWIVLRAVAASNVRGVFERPEQFEPARFGPDRQEHLRHAHGYTPQGVGTHLDHKCPGLEFTTLLMLTFTRRLLEDYDLELPAQDLALVYARIPPEPRDGLRVVLRPR